MYAFTITITLFVCGFYEYLIYNSSKHLILVI